MVDTNTNTNELPPVTDARSAALHIERLLDFSQDDETRAPVEQASLRDARGVAPVSDDIESTPDPDDEGSEVDAAADENPPSQDDGGSTEAQDAPIDPPTFWNAEDKAKFNQLPPDMQEVIVRRESERDKAISTRMNQLADERKAIEQQVQQANAVQTQYATTINQLLSLTIPELQEIEQTDWQHLANTDPAEYVRKSAVRDGLRQRVNFMQQQAQQSQQAQVAQLQQQHQAHLADQYQRLVTELPDFADAGKAKAIVHDIASAMEPYGFSQEELGSVTDSRIVKVLHRLTQLEKAEAARKSAVGKKTTPAPRLMPANAAPVRETTKAKQFQDQWKQLRKSGSGHDAAKLIENFVL